MKNIFDAAAKVEGLERIVVSTLVDTGKVSQGRYGGVWHWNGKARGVVYARERYPVLCEKMSEMFVGNYMGNWRGEVKLRKVRSSYFLDFCRGGSGKD